MKKLILVALVGLVVSGCGTVRVPINNGMGYREWEFNFFRSVDVIVINQCPNSIAYVAAPRQGEVPISFGNMRTINLPRLPGDADDPLMVVRLVGTDGTLIGSGVARFRTEQSGRRQEAWIIGNNSWGWAITGVRSCR